MALQLTVGSTDRTSALLNESVSVEHTALNHISVCSFTLYDATASISVAEEDTVSLIDGVTPYFVGRVVSVSYTPMVTTGRNIYVQAQDLNAIITETIVDVPLEFLAESDYDIINFLFDAYLPVVDSETHVAVIQDPLTIRFEPTTLASCLNQICAQSGGYWYVDFSNRLHYFIDENVPAAFGLSDTPNGSTTFSYLDKPECDIDAITRLDGVYVAGAGVEGWVGTHAPGDRTAIVWDNRITTNDGILERGNAILGKHGAPKLLYRVWTREPGLVAGQKVHFKCGIYDVDDDLSIRRIKISWGADKQPVFQLELGDPFNPALAQQAWYDVVEQAVGPVPAPLLPLSSRGWSHDLVFSATDNDTVAWAAGTLTTAGGSSFSLDAGNTGNMAATTYVFLDTDTSDTVLQTTTSVTVAVGANKIMIAVCEPQAAGLDATFFVFGSSVQGVLVDTPNILPGSITTPTLADGAVTHTKTVLGLQNWGHTLVFSATDNNTVAWEAGIITTGDGSTFNIDAGNTGDMTARTYIYLNTDVSSTVLQTTTTAANATGNNKVLIAVASPQAADYNATFIVYGSELQSTLVDTANITAGAVTAAKAATALLDWSNTLVFTATTYRQVGWAAGTIVLSNGTTYNIVAGNTGNMTAATRYYVYLDIATSTTVLQVTTTAANAVGTNKILVAVCYPSTSPKLATYQVMGGGSTGVLITADNVVANTLTTNEIAANTITAANIAAATITGTEIAAATITGAKIAALTIEAGNIAANAITATKIAAATITGDKIAANTITGGNIGANTITADKFLGVGDFVFTQDSGLLLLGPGNECVPTKWVSTRGQTATLTGAFHQVAGPWANSRALVVEPAATNLITNPRPVSSGAAWTGGSGYETQSGPFIGNTVLKVEATGYYELYSPNTISVTLGENYAVSFWARANIESAAFKVSIYKKSPGHYTTYKSLTATDAWQRFTFILPCILTGDLGKLLFYGSGTYNLYIANVQVEHADYSTSYLDGSLGTGYAWTDTPHASTSTRAATAVNLDAHAGMLSDLNTVTHSIWVQAQYDADDASWPCGANDARIIDYIAGVYNNNRLMLRFEPNTDDQLSVYLNGGNRITDTGQTFDAGDWLHLVVTLDYANDLYCLYLNGTLIGSATTALTAPTGLTDWVIGTRYGDGQPGGWAFGEYAVFNRVLTAEEVAAMYAAGRPITDAGSIDVPGVYILDGRFRIASGSSGTVLDLTSTRMAIGSGVDYNSGAGVWLGIDGGLAKFFVGNSAGNKLYWDGTTLYVVGNGSGITAIDGGNITALSITASQIAAATITGAKIAANTIEAGNIKAGTITTNEIAANTITAGNMNVATLSALTADMGTLTAGEIRVGTGTVGSTFTGYRIKSDILGGYNNNVLQAWFDVTTGHFKAGAGAVILKTNGIVLDKGIGSGAQIATYYGTDYAGGFTTQWGGGAGDILRTVVSADNTDVDGSFGAVTLRAVDGAVTATFNVGSNKTIDATTCNKFQLEDGGDKWLVAQKTTLTLYNGTRNWIEFDSTGYLNIRYGGSGAVNGLRLYNSIGTLMQHFTSDGYFYTLHDMTARALTLSGTIKTTSNKAWNLGGTAPGTITPDYKVHVEIDNQWYTLQAQLGLV